MKKNQQRKPKPKLPPQRPIQPQKATAAVREAEAKVGVISGTPADMFDDIAEHKPEKWIPIYIAVLAVLLALAIVGSNDALKNASHAALDMSDTYNYYQAKNSRKLNLHIALNNLKLQQAEKKSSAGASALTPEVQKIYETEIAEYEKDIRDIDSDAKNNRLELLAKAEACENDRALALAEHPNYDYSGALFQIAIVLASASIVAGARLLFWGSAIASAVGIMLMLNGYLHIAHYPDPKHQAQDQAPNFVAVCGN